MKWRTKSKQIPEYGERVFVTKFLLLPMSIDGTTKWLETASYSYTDNSNWAGGLLEDFRWEMGK